MDKLNLKEPNITLQSFARYVEDSRVHIVHEHSYDAQVLEFLAVSNAFGGEAGELQNITKKIVRDGVFFQDNLLHQLFILEAGDALHYLISLIQLSGHRLETVMAANVTKLDARKQAHEAQAHEGTILSTPST